MMSKRTQALVKIARVAWKRDGAEGETVHALCDELERAYSPVRLASLADPELAAVEQRLAKLETMAHPPLPINVIPLSAVEARLARLENRDPISGAPLPCVEILAATTDTKPVSEYQSPAELIPEEQQASEELRVGERVRVIGGAWESAIGKLATVEHSYPPADNGERVIRIVVDGENGTLSLAASDVQRSNDARADRDREIWEARKRGETVAELGARYDNPREKIAQICAREQAREQKRCDDFGCRQGVHEPPCPLSDPDERLCPPDPLPSGSIDAVCTHEAVRVVQAEPRTVCVDCGVEMAENADRDFVVDAPRVVDPSLGDAIVRGLQRVLDAQRPSEARPETPGRLEDGTRVRVTGGEQDGRLGVVYDQEWRESKVRLDGDIAGSWFPNDGLEVVPRTNEARPFQDDIEMVCRQHGHEVLSIDASDRDLLLVKVSKGRLDPRTPEALPSELAGVCEERDRARRDRDCWRGEAEKARALAPPSCGKRISLAELHARPLGQRARVLPSGEVCMPLEDYNALTRHEEHPSGCDCWGSSTCSTCDPEGTGQRTVHGPRGAARYPAIPEDYFVEALEDALACPEKTPKIHAWLAARPTLDDRHAIVAWLRSSAACLTVYSRMQDGERGETYAQAACNAIADAVEARPAESAAKCPACFRTTPCPASACEHPLRGPLAGSRAPRHQAGEHHPAGPAVNLETLRDWLIHRAEHYDGLLTDYSRACAIECRAIAAETIAPGHLSGAP